QMTLLPAVTRAMGNREQERALYHSAQAQVFAGVLPVAVGGCLVAPRLVSFVFGAEYGPSVLPLQILLWALPIALFRNIAQGVMIAHGRQDQMLHTSLAGAASNLILNLVLIPPLGMAGAALVTVTTESVRTVPMLRLLGKASLPMAPPARFWRTLLAAAVMTLVLLTLHLTSVWLTIAAGALAYVVTLVAVGGLRLRRGALPELRV
ncbi:MAG TPA: polysaccharide biosynthesis C-terminal domain-containing protein, partial [Gemmatimonadales bacterium]|nr:polysaccharide biosynthesis C-terminal domain-containing protein [Gemmatimonadales bacterium]